VISTVSRSRRRVAVDAIALDEGAFCDRFYMSCSGADLVFVLARQNAALLARPAPGTDIVCPASPDPDDPARLSERAAVRSGQ